MNVFLYCIGLKIKKPVQQILKKFSGDLLYFHSSRLRITVSVSVSVSFISAPPQQKQKEINKHIGLLGYIGLHNSLRPENNGHLTLLVLDFFTSSTPDHIQPLINGLDVFISSYLCLFILFFSSVTRLSCFKGTAINARQMT